MNNSFRIIKLSLTDITRVSVFLSKTAGGGRTETEWNGILEWMWVANPIAPDKDNKYGWGIEDEMGVIYGFIGTIPLQYTYRGTIYPALWGTSWYVADIVKELSLQLYINFARQPEWLFSNSQTPGVEIIMQKLGFKKIDLPWFEGAFIFPLKIFTGSFFRNALSGRSVKRVAFAVFGMAIKIPQSILFLFSGHKNIAKEISIQRISAFPENTDDWFAEFSKTANHTLVRSRSVYQWLFCNPDTADDFLKFEVVRNNVTLGFLIFKKFTIKGFRFIEIIDEALLPVTDKMRKKILVFSYFKIYEAVQDNCFLLLRSNMSGSNGFFKSLGGFGFNKIGRGFIRSSFTKADLSQATFTSIDGDRLFFRITM
jgi:hypothetical protein